MLMVAPPPNIYVIGDVPHDWLFARCRAVCHHGGAGTTSAGLRAGLPTVVVPFFGDQFFWGRVVADAGAGPEPIPIGRLTTEALTAAWDECGVLEVTAEGADGAPVAGTYWATVGNGTAALQLASENGQWQLSSIDCQPVEECDGTW